MRIKIPVFIFRGAFSKIFLELDLKRKIKPGINLEKFLKKYYNKIEVKKVYSPYIPSLSSSYKISKEIITESYEQFLNEIKILKSLNHPNIIKMKNHSSGTQPFISSYIYEGVLESLIKNSQFNCDEILLICYTIINVIEYLHNKNIGHFDLSIRNIYYDFISMNVFIGDFGLSRHFSHKS